MTTPSERYLRPREIARLLRVSPDKVLGWIRRGKLRAVDLSEGGRPQYRVSPTDLDAFLKPREVQPPPPRRKKEQMPDGGPIDPVLGEALLKKKQAVKEGNTYYRVWNGIVLYY